MSYYFPLGGTEAVTIENINYAITATTAGVPYAGTITAITASYAASSGSTPTAGINGSNQDPNLCSTSNKKGNPGTKGDIGPKGADKTTCPPGTVECTQLHVSLSMVLPGFPSGINGLRPEGSRFSKVCMQIPPGCTAVTATCPSYLPTASITTTYPSIP